MIRGKHKNCPFGLPIPDACGTVGESILSMTSISKELDDDKKEYNYQIFLTTKECGKCPFADLILKEKGAVDCKYNPEDHRKMSGNSFVSGSPIYPNLYIGNSKSYQSYPVNYYSDDNIRSIYYGLVGLVD